VEAYRWEIETMATQNTQGTRQDVSSRSRDSIADAKSGATSPRTTSSATEAKRLGERGKQEVAEQATAARDRVARRGSEFVETQKSRAADEVQIFGAAVREAGQKLKEEGQENVASYAEAVADEMERAGSYLRDRDVRRLRSDASRFARERPALFLGGMFLAGLAASRFLKASESESMQSGGRRDEGEEFLFEGTTEEWEVDDGDSIEERSAGAATSPGGSPTAAGSAPTAKPSSPPGTLPPSSSVPGTGPTGHGTNIPLPGEPARPADRPARPSDWNKTP
jgi:hypothetical protein